jgi:hypothetical protein
MKTIHHLSLTILGLLLLTAFPAKAILYLAGDPQFGPDSVTVDTSTGLAWLNLNEAAGLSYNQVLAETQAGGRFSAFRFATFQEVLNLYSSAGIPATGYYPLSATSIQSLFSLIGTTGLINGEPGVIGLSGTSVGGGAYCAPAIYAVGNNGVEEYSVTDGGITPGGSSAYGASYSFPELSSWLVRSIPEPTDADFLLITAAASCGFVLLHRRENAA